MGRSKSWTPRRQAALTAWVADAAPRVGLADWTIGIDWEGNVYTHPAPGEELGAYATMCPAPHSKHAFLCVSPQLLSLPEVEVRRILTHELMHCHLFAIEAYAVDAVEAALPGEASASRIFRSGMNQQVELLADGFSDFVYTLVPTCEGVL